jgi:hypothetical protein
VDVSGCLRLRGADDPLALPHPDDLVLLGCGHFGCVPPSSARRVGDLQEALGLPRLTDEAAGAGIAPVADVLRSALL